MLGKERKGGCERTPNEYMYMFSGAQNTHTRALCFEHGEGPISLTVILFIGNPF